MYSEYIGGLGISQNILELMVLVGIVVAVLGVVMVLFWKQIVVGSLAVFCVAVFANHKPTVTESTTVQKIEKREEVISETKDDKTRFMEDCINLADYNRTHCDDIWSDRVKEERALLEEKVEKDGSNN
jgi:hypothetical protein